MQIVNISRCKCCNKVLCDFCALICGSMSCDNYICKPCYFFKFNAGIIPKHFYTGEMWVCSSCFFKKVILCESVATEGMRLCRPKIGHKIYATNFWSTIN
jgi:hypothetical protein